MMEKTLRSKEIVAFGGGPELNQMPLVGEPSLNQMPLVGKPR